MIAIVGAGPAGSHLAYLLAKAGKEVHVFEEHSSVGEPVQCTGIVTSGVSEFAPAGKYVVNRIRDARIVAPNGEAVGVRFSSDNLIIDRTKFDRCLAERAEKAGARYHLDHRCLSHNGNDVEFSAGSGRRKHVTADIVVGADGPNSAVAKSAGLFGEREFFMGVQATIRLENDNTVEFSTGFGDFAWLVPESKSRVRIGLCTRGSAHQTFDAFMKWRIGMSYEKRIVSRQAGLIPVYDPKVRTHSGNTYLVGDAAGMVKATTAGGILQGMQAAEELATALVEGGDYEQAWRRRIGRDLYLHLLMRKVLDRMSAADYNRLVRLFQKEKNRRVLEEFDRDYPSRYLLRLLLQEPKLAGFARVLLRARMVR